MFFSIFSFCLFTCINVTVVFLFQFLKNRHLMVRVGGGWDTLENYLIHHRPVEVFEHKRLVVGEPHDIGNKYLYFKSKYRSHAQVASEHNGHAHAHWEWALTRPLSYENGQGLVDQDINNGHRLAHLRINWYHTHGFLAVCMLHELAPIVATQTHTKMSPLFSSWLSHLGIMNRPCVLSELWVG